MAARGIRAFAFSYLNVVFAIYLDRLGYSPVTIGVIFTVAYLSSALLTALWGYLSDRIGRRKILMLLALLTIISNGILIYFTSLFFILSAVIIANVGAGGSGGGGSGGGPFNPVEEALPASAQSWAPWVLSRVGYRSTFRKKKAGAPSDHTSRFSF